MLSVMSSSSTLIVFFRELRAASVETESATGISEYIRNNPDSALAQMVDEKFQQEKLRHLATRLLTLFAKKTDRDCEAGMLFAREMLAMQVLNLTATSCSTSSYINWYIVETFKEVQDQGGLLGKDTRAKEAEEAMRRAAAEAAEMTRMLEAERNDEYSQATQVEMSTPHLRAEPTPKTTFGSLLQDPDILPRNPEQVDAILQQPGVLPPPDRIDEVEAIVRASSEAPASPSSMHPSESARLSSTSLHYEEPPQETLQGAKISLMDLSSDAGTGKSIRQKSTLSYMITIELVGGRVPGWVAIKQFSDFESLHDVLRRLANVSGLRSFPSELPEWKGKLHQPLADELEQYLKAALAQKQLADSEAMKRFFGKEINDISLGKKKAWPPLKGVGEGMRGAMLSSAEGSQKLLAAAWATTGINKKRSSTPIGTPQAQTEATLKDIMKPPAESKIKATVTDDTPTPEEEDTAYHSPLFRESGTFLNQINSTQGSGLDRSSTSSSLNGYTFIGEGDVSNSGSSSSLNVVEGTQSREPVENAQPDTPRVSQTFSPSPPESIEISIPKAPSPLPPLPARRTEPQAKTTPQPPPLPARHTERQAKTTPQPPPLPERPPRPSKPTAPELSANDAQQILDIGFTVLSEFYALSPRTWLIRKSLLNLLKSLLISNGLTYIETIRSMIQEDLIKNCLTSDDWIAGQIKAVTDSMWPPTPWPPMDDEAYKVQAQELFINKMLPETMRGLMGGAATSQALEVVFEALQDQRVAKGILVALMCDVIRALQV